MAECLDCGREDHADWCGSEMIRQIQKEAWDDGYSAGFVHFTGPNPYAKNTLGEDSK